MRGRVKWFNNEKGYGFIDYIDNEDIFVHYSAIKQDGYKSLQEGQYVEFDLLETSKGYQALDVMVLKEALLEKYPEADIEIIVAKGKRGKRRGGGRQRRVQGNV